MMIGYSDCMLIARAFPAPGEEGEPASDRSTPNRRSVRTQGAGSSRPDGRLPGIVVGVPHGAGHRCEARRQLYSLVAAAVVVLVLFVAGPLIENLPQASLAAVVFYAASTLVSWQELVRLARFRTTELLLAATAALGTVLLGVLVGSAWRSPSAWPKSSCGWLDPTKACSAVCQGLAGMHDVDDYPDAQTLPGLVVYRYDAPLFFADVGDMRRRALLAVDQENAAPPSTPCDGSTSTSKPTSKSTSPPPTACATSTATSPPGVSASPWAGQNRPADAAGTGRAGRPDRTRHAVPHPPRRRGGLPVVGHVNPKPPPPASSEPTSDTEPHR